MKQQAALGRLKSLTPTIVRRLSRALLAFGEKEPSEELTPGQLLLFRFADLVIRFRILPDERRDTLLEEMSAQIVKAGNLIEAARAAQAEIPQMVIGIGNRVWAVISGKIQILNLLSGSWQDDVPLQAVEMVHYSLTQLALMPFEEIQDEAANISQRGGAAAEP